jgi:hypothetical protein
MYNDGFATRARMRLLVSVCTRVVCSPRFESARVRVCCCACLSVRYLSDMLEDRKFASRTLVGKLCFFFSLCVRFANVCSVRDFFFLG